MNARQVNSLLSLMPANGIESPKLSFEWLKFSNQLNNLVRKHITSIILLLNFLFFSV